MRQLHWMLATTFVVLGGLVLLNPRSALAQQILQNGFEGRGTYWKAGSSDAAVKVVHHRLTDETAHGGQRCEHIQLQVEKGSYIHYVLDLPRAPISEELNVRLWIKSNRPGIRLLCRMVLPRERDPKNPGQPLSVLVPCEPYQSTRWKLVSLLEPVRRLREQKQMLTADLRRDVVTTGAYISQLVLNVYGGPGLTDVWIDDLEIGPVEDTRPTFPEPTPTPAPVAGSVASNPGSPARTPAAAARRAAEVQVRGNQLWVGGKKFFLRGIRHTGSPPLRTLRDAGFNVVWLDESTPPGIVDDAASLGFWIVPSLTPPRQVASVPGGIEAMLTSRETALGQRFMNFLDHDAILAWDLGSNLGAERFTEVSRLARGFRSADPHRPVMADIWDGYRGYSRSVEQLMLGTHRWPLMTSLELPAYRQWLESRRQLTTEGYSWTWVQTHSPDWFVNVSREGAGKSAQAPVGPQPEQIRLLTYLSLAAGYRGLGFWSDRSLADLDQGKDRLLAMALLNQELTMLERLLMNASQSPDIIPTSTKEVTAAVFRTPEGVLVLPTWVGKGAQFVPGQGATTELTLTVPGVPVTATAWEVSPGRIQAYPVRRDIGGSTIRLRNFSLTSAVVFTSDLGPNGLVVRLQDMQRRMGRLAAQWLHDQAQEELRKAEKVEAELAQLGHGLSDSRELFDRARKALDRSMQHRRNGEHSEAYSQADLAARAVRVLMRAHWERAVRDLDMPVSSPYAVSFYTLPRHWQMMDQLRQMQPDGSLLPGGDFELEPNKEQPGWIVQEVPSLDEVEVGVRRVNAVYHGGKQCLMIQVKAKDPKREPATLERTYVALHSPMVKLKPGTLVRVSTWVKIPGPIRGSVDGALFFDSVGGEPLAIRMTDVHAKWRKYSLYRQVPASGQMNVTLALSGLGTVMFDDVRIEPLTSGRIPATTGLPPGAVRGQDR